MNATKESFRELIKLQWEAGRHLCVGLDTDLEAMPEDFGTSLSDDERVIEYNRQMVDATADLVAAYKPNIAFYEALGESGFAALETTISHIREAAPGVPVIVDAKRADIGNTNKGYVKAIFEELGADAVTVHPYLGGEALEPFFELEKKQVFVLARTSNSGAGELQDYPPDGLPLYRHVAQLAATKWNARGNCGLVVGATYPKELAAIRGDIPPTMPILIPGVGRQGGDLAAAVRANVDHGSEAFLINVSRSIIFASDGPRFKQAAQQEARRLDQEIRRAKTS